MDFDENKDANGEVVITRRAKRNRIFSEANEKDDDVTTKWKAERKVMQLRKRMIRTEKEATLNKLKMLLSLRLIKGPLFIYAMLEVIKLSKSILVLQLERGMEASVPMALG